MPGAHEKQPAVVRAHSHGPAVAEGIGNRFHAGVVAAEGEIAIAVQQVARVIGDLRRISRLIGDIVAVPDIRKRGPDEPESIRIACDPVPRVGIFSHDLSAAARTLGIDQKASRRAIVRLGHAPPQTVIGVRPHIVSMMNLAQMPRCVVDIVPRAGRIRFSHPVAIGVVGILRGADPGVLIQGVDIVGNLATLGGLGPHTIAGGIVVQIEFNVRGGFRGLADKVGMRQPPDFVIGIRPRAFRDFPGDHGTGLVVGGFETRDQGAVRSNIRYGDGSTRRIVVGGGPGAVPPIFADHPGDGIIGVGQQQGSGLVPQPLQAAVRSIFIGHGMSILVFHAGAASMAIVGVGKRQAAGITD